MLLTELEDLVTATAPAASSGATEPTPEGYMLSVSYCYGVGLLRWVTLGVALTEVTELPPR